MSVSAMHCPPSLLSSDRWPSTLGRPAKLRLRQGIQDVGGREPGASCLQDAVIDLLEMRSVMSIRVDDDLHTTLARHPQMYIVEVQAVRIRVQLHGNAVLECGI